MRPARAAAPAITDRAIRRFLYERRPASRKGDHGRVLVVGGSAQYSGAPALVALAALRTGADIAAVLAPSHVATAIRSFSPNLIVYEYPGTYLNHLAYDEFMKVYKRFDSFVLGSGLGLEGEPGVTLRKMVLVLRDEGRKFVLDADALKLLGPADVAKCRCVVTPHAAEYATFFGKEKPGNLCVLLKGHEDVITQGKRKVVNRTGNPGMTVGGTGDSLAGVLGALLAASDDLFASACAAAYLNGLAGDLAYTRLGNSLLATDVIECLPAAIAASR